MFQRFLFFILSVGVGLLRPGSGFSAPLSFGSGSGVAAKIDDLRLTQAEVEDYYRATVGLGGSFYPSKKEVLKILAYQLAGARYAQKKKWHLHPEFRQKQDLALYQYLVEKTLETKLKKFSPSEVELRQYYKRNPALRIRHLFIPVTSSASFAYTQKAHEEIKKLYSRLQKEKGAPDFSFGEFIQKQSYGSDAFNGGDFGYRFGSQMDPALYRAAMALTEGGMSGVVRSSFGFHVIQLLAIRPFEENPPFSVQKEMWLDVRQSLIQELHQEIEKTVSIQIQKES